MNIKTMMTALLASILAACTSNDAGNHDTINSALAGSWRLIEVGGQPLAMTGSNAKLVEFESKNNRFNGHVGCNRLIGLYQSEGQQLRFNGIASTRMACDPLTMQLEQQLMQYMEQVQYWQLNDKQLQLKNGDQQPVLKFQRL